METSSGDSGDSGDSSDSDYSDDLDVDLASEGVRLAHFS